MKIRFSIITICLLIPLSLKAQFYVSGDDPGHIRWYKIEMPHFRIIYPEGLDSLAIRYGKALEHYRMPESWSIGMVPGECQWGKTPVILHAYTGMANGSVTWTPKRMELYTVQDAYSPDPMPWIDNLAIHESRHLAQLQFGYRKWFKPFSFLLGEMFPGALSGLYPNLALLEGDAVATETALSNSGRGRSADFLNYYMMAFSNGDYRNWYRWRYGSQRYYAPDHYALGYLTVAGMRYTYGDATYSKRYYDYVVSHPLHIGDMQKTIKAGSGKKFKTAFDGIQHSFNDVWNSEMASRAPFIDTMQVVETPSRFTSYEGSAFGDDGLYSIKESLKSSPRLVRIMPNGKEKSLGPFSSYCSNLSYSPSANSLYWSENRPDPRWSMKSYSVIMSRNLADGKTRTLKSGGRYFNPSASADGSKIAITEYPIAGGSKILIIDESDGSLKNTLAIPDSLQAVQTAWIEDCLFFSAISSNGFGLYKTYPAKAELPEIVLKPQPVRIQNLKSSGKRLLFACDRTGVNEIYAIDPDGSGRLVQLTNTRYGAKDFSFNSKGDTLYYSMMTPSGRLVFKTPADSLADKPVSYSQIHKYPVAEKLSSQEAELEKGAESFENGDETEPSPQRYRKIPHIPNFHSWAPIYFNIDNIQGESHDYDFQEASAGATALFQNSLSTASGFIGYSLHEDPDGSGKMRNSGHLKFNYSGLYPIIEASLDINDRNAYRYTREMVSYRGYEIRKTYREISETPYLHTSLLAYIPFDFSRGGWSRGLIPQLRYQISNDRYDNSTAYNDYDGCFFLATPVGSDQGVFPTMLRYESGKNALMRKFTAILRGYSILPVANSQVYPSWGIGAEAGFNSRPGMTKSFTRSIFAYLYGYIPGITQVQGLRLTGTFQKQLDPEGRIRENYLETAPRGFANMSDVRNYLENRYPWQMKFTADYAIPIWAGDWSFLCPAIYVRNFVLYPHFDYSIYKDGGLYSAGCTFAVHFSNFLWLPYDSTLGIINSFNGGSLFRGIEDKGYWTDRFYIGLTFNISI